MERNEYMWLAWYLPLTWAVELAHGMMNTVIGPSQLYLAQNVGVGIDKINFIWSFGFFGYLFGSFATSAVLKSVLTKTWMKLCVISAASFFSGLFMIVLPLTSSQYVLYISRFLSFAALGALCTADQSLLVYMMGPVKSRPFVMAMHAAIGMGFLVATFLVKPFLPLNRGNSCGDEIRQTLNSTMNSTGDSEVVDTSMIHYPFLIVGGWSVFWSIGFIILAFLPFKMPVSQEIKAQINAKEIQGSIHNQARLLPL